MTGASRSTRPEVDATRSAYRYDPERKAGGRKREQRSASSAAGGASSAGAIAWSLLVDRASSRVVVRSTRRRGGWRTAAGQTLPVRTCRKMRPADRRLARWRSSNAAGRDRSSTSPATRAPVPDARRAVSKCSGKPVARCRFRSFVGACRRSTCRCSRKAPRVWLPPGNVLLGLGAGHREGTGPSWSERLFGPWVRAGHRPCSIRPNSRNGATGRVQSRASRPSSNPRSGQSLGARVARGSSRQKTIHLGRRARRHPHIGRQQIRLCCRPAGHGRANVWPLARSNCRRRPAGARRKRPTAGSRCSKNATRWCCWQAADSLVFTTGLDCSADEKQLADSETPSVVVVRPGPLCGKFRPEQGQSSRFLERVTGWKAQRRPHSATGQQLCLAPEPPAGRSNGSKAVRMAAARSSCSTARRRATPCSSFLMVAIFCWWRGATVRNDVRRLARVAAVALLVPAELDPDRGRRGPRRGGVPGDRVLVAATPPNELSWSSLRGGSSIGRLAGGTACLLVSAGLELRRRWLPTPCGQHLASVHSRATKRGSQPASVPGARGLLSRSAIAAPTKFAASPAGG